MTSQNEIIKPFLRWAGGKTWLTKHIDDFLPDNINNYFEPFLGGGAIFFYLKSKNLIKGKSYLSDKNRELINTYNILKSKPKELIELLKKQKNTEIEYYKLRKYQSDDKIERAARFLFLNKTSFNGIYRVNQQGIYNVPYGYRKLNDMYDYENLMQISNCLTNCYFSVKDFKKITRKINLDDFVFIDPPYTVAHENNGFIQYNQSLFSWENQIELAKLLVEIESKNANFIMTNASHKSIKKLYKDKGIRYTLNRASNIGGIGANRTNYKELIYTNLKTK
jgi:DNA adenine methylase